MSSEYFGNFLISKKIINENALISALIEQLKNSQSTFEILFEKKLIAAQDSLKILEEQQASQSTYKSAALKLNLWKKEFDSIVEDHLNSSRPPLGKILIDQGILDLKKLTSLLDEFFSEKAQKVNSAPQKEIILSPSPLISTGQTAKNVTTFAKLQVEDLVDFRDIFDERKIKSFNMALVLIRDKFAQDQESRQKLLKNALQIIQTINGHVFLKELMVISNLLDLICNLISKQIEKAPDQNQDQAIATLLMNAVDLSYMIRESVMETLSEEKFYLNPETKSKYDDIMSKLTGAL